MTTHESSLFARAVRIAGVFAVVVAVLAVDMPEADACDACNNAFKHEILNERSDTPAGQDMIRAMENQQRLNVTSQKTNPEETVDSVALADVEEEPMQPIPTSVTPAAGTNGGDNIADAQRYQGSEFIDIIERDEGLANTPPTGYVSQEAEPDVEVDIDLDEGMTYLGQGVMYHGFLTNGAIPGPTVRVTEGDIVRFNIENTGSVPHGGSIHSAYTQTSAHIGDIGPGETKSVTFRVTYPGVFMYHCAPGGHAIPMHVLFGQYGMMVVEPKEDTYKLEEELGHEPDLKLYMLQNEIYASGADAVEGNPEYTGFNGRPFRYVEEPIAVEPGDYVRMYFLNVGPNLLSTFHIVGIIWDYVYWQGHPEARLPGGQSVTAGPTDSFVIEFRIPPEEGVYTMLSHVVGPTSRGAIGLLAAEMGSDGPSEVLAEGETWTEEELEEMAENAVRTVSPFEPGSQELQRPEIYGPEVEEVFVDIKGNSYTPGVIEIEPGTKVTFTNQDVFTYLDGEFSGIHNAVGISGPEEFATDMLAHGESDTIVFDEPGEYEYLCTPHPYMRGKIIVRDAADDADPEEDSGGCSTVGGAPMVPVSVALLMLMGLAVVKRHDKESVPTRAS